MEPPSLPSLLGARRHACLPPRARDRRTWSRVWSCPLHGAAPELGVSEAPRNTLVAAHSAIWKRRQPAAQAGHLNAEFACQCLQSLDWAISRLTRG